MDIRNLGGSGLRVSAVGLGCNNFGGRLDLEQSRKVINAAFDAGITLFDTADVYGNRGGSETVLGQILGSRRDDIVLASKFGMAMDDAGARKGAARRYIVAAVEDSLRRLGTDRLDLYQQHRPDPLTPIEETMRALEDLVRAGKVLYVGCSNLVAWQVVEAQMTARQMGFTGFISCQDEYSLLVRDAEKDLLPVSRQFRMGLLPYYPLASGMLTGKYVRRSNMPPGSRLAIMPNLADHYMTDRNWDRVEALQRFCTERGRSMLDLAFGWLLARQSVASVIAGASTPEQVFQNVAASTWAISAEDMAAINAITD